MAATASTKDLTRALTAYLSVPSPALPLPDDVTRVIEAYLAKHAKQDDYADEHVQNELLQLYKKLVHAQASRIAPFLAVLRALRPRLWTSPRAAHWFDVLCDDVLDHIWKNKALAQEVNRNYESVMTANIEDPSGTEAVMGRCLDRWMQYANASWQSSDAAAGFKEGKIRDMMLAWGKKYPKLFMDTLDPFFVKAEFRARAVMMLCEFIQSEPPHLHLAADTRLFAHIITSLQTDNSTTVVSLVLTALSMLLPHFPSSLVPHLPALFNIYARILFWDRERFSETSGPRQTEDGGVVWDVAQFSPSSEGTEIPQLLNYFTTLYGLYPINFLDYIRKPQRWLRHANAPNPEDIEVQPSEIRYRSERFRRLHLLHPNFYTLTVDSEKTDFGRWLKSEPAVVVAECMELCVSGMTGADSNSAPAPLAGAQVFQTPGQQQSSTMGSPSESRARSAVARRNSQSSHHFPRRESLDNRTGEIGIDSPTLPPMLLASPSQTRLQDMIRSNQMMKSSIGQSVNNDSVPSLSLSHQDSTTERQVVSAIASQHSLRSPWSASEGAGEIAHLQRQMMVLKNDLNFERYVKQQHMAHIGELRRRHMKEAETEAETQKLIMNNRNLKYRLEEAKRVELQVKKDSERSRALAHKWEAELSAKLRNIRAEQKTSKAEIETLRRELGLAKDECEKLRAMVCEAEVKELNAAQAMQSLEINMAEMTRLGAELARLMVSERDYQAKQAETDARLQEAEQAEHRAGVLELKVAALESELQAAREQFQSQVVVLNARLAEAQKVSRGKSSDELAARFERIMTASRTKQDELQRQYIELLQRHTTLQSTLLDKAQEERERTKRQPLDSAQADAQVSAIVGPSFSQRARMQQQQQQQAPADLDSYDLSLQESFGSGTSTGTAVYRPETPSRVEAIAVGSSTSPQSERYYGRGGVQNTNRKEKKEKKKEDHDKKDKKPSGIRGIRGFV